MNLIDRDLCLCCRADLILWRLCRRLGFAAPLVLLAWASSWPVLVLLPRTFSNGTEALIVALLLWITLDPAHVRRERRGSRRGAVPRG